MKRFCSMALAAVMVISMLTMTAAAGYVEDGLATTSFSFSSNKHSTLAPGVELDELVVYSKDNKRVEMYVTTVDPAVDTVQIKANYKDNQNDVWGMQSLSDQVAAMEANYEEPFKIVAGINASYYNTGNGAPTGAFVMEGKDASSTGDSYAFFAMLKDGTYMIGNKGEYSKYKDQLQEAIGGYYHIVIDGAVAPGLDKTTLYPRQTIGMTADGKVILMTADGSQEPKTAGTTIQEQAEIMLALGCVDALHLDGGNSATFGIIPEGEDKFVTKNSPSGGAEREVSNTLMIISTAVADGTFDHAVIEGDYNYYAAGSTYTFSAFGVDATNAAAEIPETAVWTLSDDSFGTISDGTFVSSGKLGKVNIQMSDNGKVVGFMPIEVVHPTSIAFANAETTIPYGKSAEIVVNAKYGEFDAFLTADVLNWTVAPAAAGTMNGFEFVASNDESIAGATVTAAYKYDASLAAASIVVKFGKGSEVLFDFEDGDISDWHGTDTVGAWVKEENAKYPGAKYQILTPETFGNSIENVSSHVFLASEENGGKVKTGDYALGVKLDRLNAEGVGNWIYNYLFYTGDTQVWRDVQNGKSAVRLGMWVNLEQNAQNTAFRICRTFTKDSSGKLYSNYDYMFSDYDGAKVSYNTNYGIPESGWIYVYFDLDAYDFQSSLQYNPNENYAMNNGKGADGNYYPAFIQFINGTNADDDTMEELVLYIDDITLDFSDVTDDRDAPTVSNTEVCYDTANFVALNGQIVNSNDLSFSARVSDVSGSGNATGIDYDTAKIYIDGMDMSDKAGFKAANGYITLNNVYLTNGKHNVAFVVCDKQGNETRVTKSLTVAGTADNTVISLVGRNDGNNVPEAGSVYYVDIKASDAAKVEEISTVLKLNTANTFEYDQIILAEGITAEVSKHPINNELSVVLTHDGTLSGEAVLASIPVRVWSWDESTGITADAQFASGGLPIIDIECATLYGAVTENGKLYSFSGAMDVKTKLDNDSAWHKHTPYALADQAATCTVSGYTGRTYCDGCKSVVAWGTTEEALAHDWAINAEGKLACLNNPEELFSGVYTDGKTYVDGVVVGDGWVEIDGVKTYYFLDGVMLTGSHMIDGTMTTFDENGIYLPNYRYDGWYEIDDTVMYFVGNEYMTGYQKMDYKAYYFDENGKGYDGEYVIDGKKCIFDDGLFASCEDETVVEAGWCGRELRDVEYTIYTNGEIRITGEGDMMNFAEAQYVAWSEYTHEDIKSVTIGKDITKIGNHAFRNCFVAASLTFEEGSKVNYIGLRAFHNMRGLRSVVLPEGLEVLRQSAFGYTYNLKNVYLPESLITIEKDAFVKSHADLTLDVAEGSVGESYAVANKIKYTTRSVVLKNGILEEDGVLYYYVAGKKTAAGLVKVDDYYYYASSGGKIVTGRYWVSRTNDLLPAGYYNFDAETGRLDIKTGIYEEDGALYYYVDGARTGAGLVKVDGYYYYASSGGKIVTGRYWVSRTNDLLKAGYYNFDAETGRLDIKNGIYAEDGALYYYVDGARTGAGLIKIDGYYYYASSGGKIVTGRYWVSRTNDLLKAGYYNFDAETGRLDIKNGIYEEDGALYYYVDGMRANAGLVQVDGDYYYTSSGGKIVTGKYWVGRTNDLMPAGYYNFDAETGKMVF